MRKGRKVRQRLWNRIADYVAMINQKQIGDGHRGPEGYKRPVSNKK